MKTILSLFVLNGTRAKLNILIFNFNNFYLTTIIQAKLTSFDTKFPDKIYSPFWAPYFVYLHL